MNAIIQYYLMKFSKLLNVRESFALFSIIKSFGFLKNELLGINKYSTRKYFSFFLGTNSYRFTSAIVLFLMVVLVWGCSRKREIYFCPMHPDYNSDRPGTCPICNMDLVKKENNAEHNNTHQSEEMELHSDPQRTDINDHVKSFNKGDEEDNSPEVELSMEKQQSIGIKTEPVMNKSLVKKLSVFSTVAFDPELYAALLEYRQAVISSENLSEIDASIPIQNLQLRLRQLGLGPEQVRVWISGQRDPAELIIGGKGGRSHIYSQIYESDLSIIKSGLSIKFKTDVYPDKDFSGRIKSIDTILDKNSRTLRLRSEVSDPQHLLKPQMFGNALLEVRFPTILSIPTSAIIDTGTRKIVYLQTEPNKFRAVTIITGRSIDSVTEVVSGLKEGQRVVAESTFLIDSEAKIRFGSNKHTH